MCSETFTKLDSRICFSIHRGQPSGDTRRYSIDCAIDAFLPKALREHQYAILVFRGIVAVTDKNFRRIRRHLALDMFLSDLTGFVSLEPYI
jgi:hypothetical protein